MGDSLRTVSDGGNLPVAPTESSSAQDASESFQHGPSELDLAGLYPRRMDASQKEFRLVSFEDPLFEEICMHMHCVSLEDSDYFEYEALSYACDGPLIATPRNSQNEEVWLSQVALPLPKTSINEVFCEENRHTGCSDLLQELSSESSPNIIPKTRTILVNNHTLEVKDNLYLALR